MEYIGNSKWIVKSQIWMLQKGCHISKKQMEVEEIRLSEAAEKQCLFCCCGYVKVTGIFMYERAYGYITGVFANLFKTFCKAFAKLVSERLMNVS